MRVGLKLLKVGACRHPTCVVTGRMEPGITTFPALVGCIFHPTRGIILFDTGYSAAMPTSTDPVGRLYNKFLPFALAPQEACVHQLQHMGFDQSDVSAIFLSHLHPDHAGGLRDFPNAKIYLSRAAYLATLKRGFFSDCRAALIRDLIPPDLESRVHFVEDCADAALPRLWRHLDTGKDLFGDGSLTAISLPGHAPGHHGLLLETQAGRQVLLAGDAAWLSRCYQNLLEPLWPARIFLSDYKSYIRTLHAIHDLALQNRELAIVPSHCSQSIEALQHELA